MKPLYYTDLSRKYLSGRLYEAVGELEILGGGRFRPGTSFSATGHLGSMLYRPCRGKRRPQDLLIEVRKRRKCRQPNVYDVYWVPARLFDIPGLIGRVRKHRTKEKIRKGIEKAIRQIESIGRPAQSSSR